MRLAQRIDYTSVRPGSAAVFYLGQEGFMIKTGSGKSVVMDPGECLMVEGG